MGTTQQEGTVTAIVRRMANAFDGEESEDVLVALILQLTFVISILSEDKEAAKQRAFDVGEMIVDSVSDDWDKIPRPRSVQ